jgi:hypothetical protein
MRGELRGLGGGGVGRVVLIREAIVIGIVLKLVVVGGKRDLYLFVIFVFIEGVPSSTKIVVAIGLCVELDDVFHMLIVFHTQSPDVDTCFACCMTLHNICAARF